MGVKVEVIGDVRKKIDGTREEAVDVTENLTNVRVESRDIRVPVLQLEYEGQAHKKIDKGEESRRSGKFSLGG
jgi:RNase P/RNase MRP subunit p29